MQDLWFFDRFGTAVFLYLGAENRFVDRRGRNLGYIYDNNKIYNYRGRHVGWIENFVVRDNNGSVLAFASGANDYPAPIFPIPQIPPIPAIPQIPPIPAIPQIPKLAPIKRFGWSSIKALDLFD